MGFCRMLCVLQWKHSVVMRRRILHTILVMLAPLTLYVLVYLLRDVFLKIYLDMKTTDVIGQSMETALHNLESISRVLYTPYTPLTSLLMSEVGKSLSLSERNGEPNHITSGYWAVDNSSVLENFVSNMTYDEAIVIFEDLDGETLPQKLNYTIRMKEPFLTSMMKSLDGLPTSHSSFGDIYGIFMNLQWAIDKSYLKLRSGSDSNKKITFQGFPSSTSTRYLHAARTMAKTLRYINWLSMLLPFVFQVLALLEERASGVVELIKIVGVTTNMVAIAHFLNTIPSALVFSILATVLLRLSLLRFTNILFVFVALFLQYCNVMAMAYPVSYVSKTTNYATSRTLICYVILWIPITLIYGKMVYICVFLPFMPISWFFEEISVFEMFDISIEISEMAAKHTTLSQPILLALVFLLLQTALCFVGAWYLDKVHPGAYGVALPWNFLCMKSFWSKKVDPVVIAEVPRANVEDPLYFEPPPKNRKVGIKINDVSKIYGTRYGHKNIALSHLTVDFYEGEITVLLGHNGAGKTTLMSIITGMISSTYGKVLVKGMDNIQQREEVRRHLGFCPQHNMNYSELTVLEHAMLFSKLKGLNNKQAKTASLQLMAKLKLEGKENFKSSQLSGGMKRRLQLACALAGNATVLILDEPTSGLDVETRRELWNLLLSLRGTCTVVISTHFMEEADALGDRVVAIHQGQLRCRATPMHLKKAVGTGYRLSLTLNKSANESAITSIISKHVAGVAISDRTSTSISYRMPATSSDSFPKMFNDLESNRQELGIETIGVGVTTLDEVFLKLCSDVDTAEEIESTKRVEAVTYNKISGFPLYRRILKILVERQLKATRAVKWNFFIMQLFVPLVSILLCTASLQGEAIYPQPDSFLMLNLDVYKDNGVSSVLLDMRDKESLRHLRTVAEDYPDFEFVKSTNVSEAVLRSGMNYNKYLIGLESNSTNVNIRYTTIFRHAAPVALNLYSNFRALELLPTSSGAKTITTYNYPIKGGRFAMRADFVEPSDEFITRLWAIIVTFLIMVTLANEVILPCREREHGSRHIQIMSGCPPVMFWLVTWIYDFIIYMAGTVLITLLLCMCLNKVYSALDFIVSFLVVLIIGGLAYLVFVYCISFFYDERSAGVVLMVIVFIFGFLIPILLSFFEQKNAVHLKFFNMISTLFPPYMFANAAVKMAFTARANTMCRRNAGFCPDIADDYSTKFSAVCCSADLTKRTGPFKYFGIKSGIKEIQTLLLHIVIYGTLVILLEYGLVATLNNIIMNRVYKPPEKRYHDDLVTQEEQYCERCVLKNKQAQHATLVRNVHKLYMRCCKKPMNAVRGISFSVKKGECFGLLGVNGAGKSTTFKMLTSEEECTRGSMFANGYNVKERSKYLYSMAYCPQFGGLDMFLTGEQNLRQLLIIRGLNDSDVNKEVNIWLGCVGLQQYAKREASDYSGGCLRRLAAAVALSSGAPVSLLDEPTTGVDTAARRRVWIALKRGLAQKRSVIITSHSMDEMEALCNRIAILSHGEICALGSSPALRAAYGFGLSLKLKIKQQDHRGASKSTAATPVENLKTDLLKSYPGSVRDEHTTMLHYHMDNKVPYSELFQYMEQLRTKYPDTLEDYSVNETTLEEVFLSFARQGAAQTA